MASRRQDRVEALLQREIAGMLVRDEIRDPRLQPGACISITGVKVSADFGHARVFFDIFGVELSHERVLSGFRSCQSRLRSKLGQKLQMRRIPELVFEYDESIARGDRIEQILEDIRTDSTEGEGSEGDGASSETGVESAE